MKINSVQNSEEVEMLEVEIKAETENLKEIWIPKIKDIISLYEKDEISYAEAKHQIEDLRKEYMEQ